MKTREEDLQELGEKLQFMKSMGATPIGLRRELERGIARILLRNAIRAFLEENPDLGHDDTV